MAPRRVLYFDKILVRTRSTLLNRWDGYIDVTRQIRTSSVVIDSISSVTRVDHVPLFVYYLFVSTHCSLSISDTSPDFVQLHYLSSTHR